MKKKILEQNKKNNGITLIALVITIIVLLILAGVSIAMLTGDNGILTKAKEAREASEYTGAKELIEIEVAGSFNDEGIYDAGIAKKNIENNLGATVILNTDETLDIYYKGYHFNVSSIGEVKLVGKSEDPGVNYARNPMLIDTSSFLWMRKQSATLQTGMNYSTQDSFYVTAEAGSGKINITSGTGIERLNVNDTMWGAVLMYDDGTCKPCIVTAVDTENKVITVYPENKSQITNGKLEPLYSDSQHLTELGYKALMQYIYNINPKYCDKTVVYNRYAPTSNAEMNTPYSKLAGSPELYTNSRNDYSGWSMSQSKYGTFMIPYIDYSIEGEYGVEREINLNGKEGFYETYIGTTYYDGITDTSKLVKDSGYELHIEWYIDENLVSETLKDTNYVERFCFDIPKDALKAKIKVYYTKMRKDKDDTISIGDSTVWTSTSNYGKKLISDKSSVVQMFDSWGTFWNRQDVVEENGISYDQGASGKEMQRLLGSDTIYYNRSISGMTSRYGKAWFNKTVVEKHPNYVLLNYGINDENLANGAKLDDVFGPDGDKIDMSVAMTVNEFADNMHKIFSSAKDNNITPIYICSSIAVESEWTTTFISELATFYN